MDIQEKLVYEIWKEAKFIKELVVDNSVKIEIIDPGTHNKGSAGPDFLNARIKFGNITYLGDVEIDTWHSDWRTHGHFFDKKYNKVILHVVIVRDKHQPFVYSKDGRKIHSICILDFIDENFQTALLEAAKTEKQSRKFVMPCFGRNDSVQKKEKLEFLIELGLVRFNRKSKRLLERLKEMIYLKEMNVREPMLKYDFGEDFYSKKYSPAHFDDIHLWEQLIYEMIFEALGYSRNKEIMMKLAKSVNISFLNNFRTDANFEFIIESALFNVSGIIPQKQRYKEEVTAEYIRKLLEVWNTLRADYDGMIFKRDDWNFFKSRPQNFPTVRLVGGASLISHFLTGDLFRSLIKYFSEERTVKEANVFLRNQVITEAKGYWTNHYNFDKPTAEKLNYFIGVSRADEIIINVLLPVLILYFEIFEKKESARNVKQLYINYTQYGSNKVVEQVESTLGLVKSSRKSINYQAMIELFRSYCVKERCLECKIGKKIFN